MGSVACANSVRPHSCNGSGANAYLGDTRCGLSGLSLVDWRGAQSSNGNLRGMEVERGCTVGGLPHDGIRASPLFNGTDFVDLCVRDVRRALYSHRNLPPVEPVLCTKGGDRPC